MAILNKLPVIGGQGSGVTYIGIGWKDSSGGNADGLRDLLYIDNEFWTKSDRDIICNKDFDALILLAQGNLTNTATSYRTLYHTDGSGDIIGTSTSNYSEAHIEYHFTQGETIRGWQQCSGNTLSIGAYIILEI